ncbi:MAG TPA: pitrilysin family protein [Thermoanaerobaculia bacterium]|jgi:predicted Zn-dependent peptidase|nr:pitrilysin family protein [Thermoanaerobaculia bacterium]
MHTSRRPLASAALATLAFLAPSLAAPIDAPAAPAATPAPSAAAAEAHVPVTTFQLDNGMRFLLVRRPQLATVSAGWVAHVGSANERPGMTGLAHLFEHMLFKGTTTIGTTNIARDLQIIAEQEQLQEQIREKYREQRERYRRGEIKEPFGPAAAAADLAQLEERFQKLVDEQRQLMVKDEYDKVYTEAGASGINASTNQDVTLYFLTVPANKVELWFWMESDRLAHPVFREFYSERDVVYEERRLRTESTPTGPFDEEFEAMFWEAHPYHWPVVGWPSDLRVISKQQADEFFKLYYAPNNLTATLVGNFDPVEVEKLARRYFGRLQPSPKPPDVATLEPQQLAEKRMLASCDCQPQARVRYHTVAFEHADSYALEVLAGLLNGRTGRLYKSMVLDQQVASSVSANQDSKKYAGDFEMAAEAKGEHTPEELEQAWYEQLGRLQKEPVPELELQKVKNQIAADAFRRLQSPFFLMLQLLYYDGEGDWRYLDQWAARTKAVSAADVQRVAQQYFAAENRTVGVYRRKAGSAAEALPPEIAKLPPQAQQMVTAQLRQLRAITDAEKLQQIVGQLEEQAGKVPAEMKPAFDLIRETARRRLAEVKGAAVPKQEKP